MEEKEVYQKITSEEFKKKRKIGIDTVKEILLDWNEKQRKQQQRDVIKRLSGRIKSPESIVQKIRKKGYQLDFKDGVMRLNDLAGIRAVCICLEDIYHMRDFLVSHESIHMIKEKDYILNPKNTGYRSLHLIFEIRVQDDEWERVELQIRTCLMDYWSNLEHQLVYKCEKKADHLLSWELSIFAEFFMILDCQMLKLYKISENTVLFKNKNEVALI